MVVVVAVVAVIAVVDVVAVAVAASVGVAVVCCSSLHSIGLIIVVVIRLFVVCFVHGSLLMDHIIMKLLRMLFCCLRSGVPWTPKQIRNCHMVINQQTAMNSSKNVPMRQ